jgi:hypothetical protein
MLFNRPLDHELDVTLRVACTAYLVRTELYIWQAMDELRTAHLTI